MSATITQLSHRDRAILRAVAAGRCQISGGACTALLIDGVGCCDQFAGARLTREGLIAPPGPGPQPARLTAHGRALAAAA
ncbi:hypothetical protein [Actinophytocola sp.]|uniref:hypothetical protein n=1 Tax=Actinophytocola sp. TaxID=1872138 RepID=UPI002D7FFD16|nr:hypothetical protein [Actinophytocola sp.]HET9142185.1 hypothetical protein [Actinophytocola sp.]